MSDWAQGVYKAKPGLKCYLFVGPYGNALDFLVDRVIDSAANIVRLRPPFTSEDLSIVVGVGEQSQTTLIRGMESATQEQWAAVEQYLTPARVKGRNLVMVAEYLPALGEASAVRYRVSKQGLYIDAQTPNGQLSRKYLAEWFAAEAIVSVKLATEVCHSVDYSLEALVWSLKRYKVLSSGKELSMITAQKLMSVAVPKYEIDNAYYETLQKNPLAVSYAAALDNSQTREYICKLESAISDIAVMYPLVTTGMTPKKVADKTGIHIVRVLEFGEITLRYPPASIWRCRQALELGFNNMNQDNVAEMVALLWQ